ncbi:FtsH protease activity modulator HflK [Mycoavidus sp. HKI]|uniref:FtsH protease activity modulator HflK n=1 Tax=Mycoavidus sp. HKI TaxID=2840467 RepID=UPI001CBE8CA4|nr:FtsH protease activity modulator HflK [Mycoavidus sp. HKI]UAW64618.1 FtsH protease activity modulator HflK [Mycoavidus sp. HKI]
MHKRARLGFDRLQGQRLEINGAVNSRNNPPDLDELWRDFNRRLSRLFGLKEAANGGRGPFGGGKNNRYYGIGIGCALLLAIWLGSGAYIVGEGQAGVITQLGSYKYTTTSTGIRWHLPYPFQSCTLVDLIPAQPVEIGGNKSNELAGVKASPMLTRDGKLVDARFTIRYQIKDAHAFLFNNVDAQASIAQAGEAAARAVLGKLKLDDLLSHSRETAVFELKQKLQNRLDLYHTGILIKDVTMQTIRWPAQIQAAFDDALKATQENERQKKQANAHSDALLARARADVAQMINEAEGHKARVIAQAQGDAERFKQVFAEYLKAPAVIREHLYLETMQQVYGNATKVLVDNKMTSALIHLPLDKLLANSAVPQTATPDASPSKGPAATAKGAAGAAHVAGQSPAPSADRQQATGPTTPASANPASLRDMLRTRDRNDDGR